MYSRQNDRNRDLRIPRNYSGNVIFSDPTSDDPIKQHTARDLPLRKRYAESVEKPRDFSEQEENINKTEDQAAEIDNEIEFATAEGIENEIEDQKSKTASLLSPIGALGSEELLLIALALIIFQGGKEPEVALLLLALLFIN